MRTSSRRTLRRPFFTGVAVAVATAAALASPAPAPAADTAAARTCPPGYHHASRPAERAAVRTATKSGLDAVLDAAVDTSQRSLQPLVIGACISNDAPESFGEHMAATSAMVSPRVAPYGSVRPGAYAAALRQRAEIARGGSAVPGTGGTWEHYGRGQLTSNDEEYDDVNGLGLVEVAGRVQDFAYDAPRDVVYVSVANGGVWRSTDRGTTWRSIGDRLPSQIVASVAYTPADGGAVVVVTGDSAYGGSSLTGVGVYRTIDQGRTWVKARGVPDGVLGFRVAVDPVDPRIVYAATGGGLYRSTDAARSFVNVVLPTGECAGVVNRHPCFLANMVTDVVVQAPGGRGEVKGGTVVASVGWRAGDKPNEDGSRQAPANGIYGSPTGRPGTFRRLDQPADGFAAQPRIGRIELGAATGPDQDHNILYAVVQDAVKFNDGAVGPLEAPPQPDLPGPVQPAPINTSLEGIYVSSDFGDTWTLMQSGDELAQSSVAAGSALAVTGQALGFAPGVQAWYNMFIKPDPTKTDAATGAPTRLVFGLEEVWQNEVPAPQVGPSRFKVIGRYFGDETCFLLGVDPPVCPSNRTDEVNTTTHPDQHGAIFLPGPDEDDVTLLVGNDGGVYKQVSEGGEEFTNDDWGRGSNTGFNTLLPYDAKMAKDGRVWAGLQDNGHIKIEPGSRRQITTFGGDGTFAGVDPDDSDLAYEALPGGVMYRTADGGRSWTGMDPALTNSAFITQFALDPLDADHLVTGGQEIVETLAASATGDSDLFTGERSPEWAEVFDLGSNEDSGAPNRMSAVDVRGDNIYVGFCGYCDVLTQAPPFANGIATNVGGDEPPSAGTSDGWHVASAKGLPNRYVNSVTIDPAEPRTVYVTLGGYGRRWAPPGAVGEDTAAVGEGHVFKSTDAGENFVDISGNLPDVPANWLEVRNSQLIVATDVGVFASTSKAGGRYGLLGGEHGLPAAPVFTVQLAPHDPNLLVAAVHGRGVWTYRFADPIVRDRPARPARPAPQRPLPATGGTPLLPVAALLALTAAAAAVTIRRRDATRTG